MDAFSMEAKKEKAAYAAFSFAQLKKSASLPT
jgi:hypothetical protein